MTSAAILILDKSKIGKNKNVLMSKAELEYLTRHNIKDVYFLTGLNSNNLPVNLPKSLNCAVVTLADPVLNEGVGKAYEALCLNLPDKTPFRPAFESYVTQTEEQIKYDEINNNQYLKNDVLNKKMYLLWYFIHEREENIEHIHYLDECVYSQQTVKSLYKPDTLILSDNKDYSFFIKPFMALYLYINATLNNHLFWRTVSMTAFSIAMGFILGVFFTFIGIACGVVIPTVLAGFTVATSIAATYLFFSTITAVIFGFNGFAMAGVTAQTKQPIKPIVITGYFSAKLNRADESDDDVVDLSDASLFNSAGQPQNL